MTTIASANEVGIGGHRVETKAGDWILESESSVAVVSRSTGRIVAFAPREGKNGLVYIEPAAFVAFDALPRDPPRIELTDGVLHLIARIQTMTLEHHVWLALEDNRLTIASQLRNTGDERVLAVTLGERPSWSNTPTWLAGHGELLSGGSRGGAFIGRDGPGSSYALCNHDGRVNVKISRPSAPGFHRTPSVGRDRITIAAGGRSPMRTVTVAHGETMGAAVRSLPCDMPHEVMERPAIADGWGVDVALCESERAFDARLERSEGDTPTEEERERRAADPYVRHLSPRGPIIVPHGCARVRLTKRGHAPGAWIDPRGPWKHDKLRPRAGTLAWRIREKGSTAASPAKIIVRGKGKTKTPNWGEDVRDGAARNYIYSVADGSIAVPPGKYEVSVYRGFEFTRHVETIDVVDNETATLSAKLERVVDTRGWVSADLHVHAMPSWDAPASLEDRVRSLAAVGVEVAVATDHNAVTDYRPAIDALGLSEHLTSLVGDEVTTEETMLGHFNVFPLDAGSPPLAHAHVHPHDLFADARKRANGGVIQVNHPRMGSIGYFELLHLDRGNARDWAARATLGDLSFDAIEVFSGDHYDDIEEVEWVLDDWYALLNAGMRHAATGNSDSHKVAYQDAGMPRNWIAVADDRPLTLDAKPLIAAIREARIVVSSGPFIRFRAGDKTVGDTVDPASSIALDVLVDAPDWIDVRRVELLRNGHIIKRWSVTDGKRPRFRAELSVPAKSGDWFIVVARGDRATPNVYRSGATPFAFTNPIWIR